MGGAISDGLIGGYIVCSTGPPLNKGRNLLFVTTDPLCIGVDLFKYTENYKCGSSLNSSRPSWAMAGGFYRKESKMAKKKSKPSPKSQAEVSLTDDELKVRDYIESDESPTEKYRPKGKVVEPVKATPLHIAEIFSIHAKILDRNIHKYAYDRKNDEVVSLYQIKYDSLFKLAAKTKLPKPPKLKGNDFYTSLTDLSQYANEMALHVIEIISANKPVRTNQQMKSS